MTEFASYPLPLTFMPTMASHRPKRKSSTKTFLDDSATANGVRGEDMPPLKKTRRSSPDRSTSRAVEQTAKPQTRTTRSTVAAETDESTDNIFSKGPSRAKRAKRSQKERDRERGEQEQKPEPPAPQESTTASRTTGPPKGGSPSRSRRTRVERAPVPEPPPKSEPEPQPQIKPKSRSRTKNIENEKPLPTPSARPPATTRKTKAQVLETPGRNAPKVRRSPRNAASEEELSKEEDGVGGDKPLKVPLAAIEDTPLVRKRNKEMREAKGHRRSSLGLRGRRASSLSNGFIAAPHPDVLPNDFYKHLDPEMIETQRMQQLLAWCSKCALSEKRARGRDAQSNARAAARVIEEDILADLTEKKLNVNWWDASEETESTADVPKKPNPKNEDHKRKIEALEKQLEQLNCEKKAWSEICEKAPGKMPRSQKEGGMRPEDLDVALLRPEEAAVIPKFENSDKAIGQIQDVISKGCGSLEFKVDQFSHGMHKAQQYSLYAKGVTEKVLGTASSVLDVRQEAAMKAAGTTALPLHEVLKSISHLDRG
ncbi:hypothetical protein TWF217_003176 [Orbilia oligospora]|nr:hypothetical protein TWF751_007125 [Orbilia oligospora]KAF3235307.1 hypothetical protein TWF217_003176 [Orbilia oligospora]KAF3239284.1 hypothetical protein TWF128_011799 [Orbilia oligospora]KAF3288961.1 hypothetical protein TWF132_007831 [Orbilia oligospora]